jgi:hypothetical protein
MRYGVWQSRCVSCCAASDVGLLHAGLHACWLLWRLLVLLLSLRRRLACLLQGTATSCGDCGRLGSCVGLLSAADVLLLLRVRLCLLLLRARVSPLVPLLLLLVLHLLLLLATRRLRVPRPLAVWTHNLHVQDSTQESISAGLLPLSV